MLPRLAVALLPMLALSLAPPLRAADSASQARELFQKGQRELEEGKSNQAIQTFESAYRAGRSASLLFYLGEAYRQAGQNAKAIEQYQLYIRKVPHAPKKAEAEAHIAALKKAPAVEAPKRKMELDDLDLGAKPAASASAAQAPAPAAAPMKKMELDEVELTGPSHAASERSKADKRAAVRARRAARKEAAAEAAQASAKAKTAGAARTAPAPAPSPSTLEQIDQLAQTPPQPTVAAPPAGATTTAPANSADVNTLASMPDLDGKTEASAPAAPAVAMAPQPASAPTAPTPTPFAPTPEAASSDISSSREIASSAPASGAQTSAYRAAPPLPALVAQQAPRESDGSGMRTAGVVVGSVGIAALVAGGLCGLGASAAANDVNNEAAAGQPYNPSVQDRGQRDQTLETGFLIGGGAAVIGGVLLFVLSPSSGETTASVEAKSSKAPGADSGSSLALSSALLMPVPGGVAASASLRF